MKSDDERVDSQDEQPTTNDDDMEEWMNTWQAAPSDGDLSLLREKFASAQWRQRLKDIAILTISIIAAAVLATAIVDTVLLSELVVGGSALVLTVAMIWKRYRRMRRHREALPLSPEQYIEATEYNLSLMERENRFLRRSSPVVFLALWAGVAWMSYDSFLVATAAPVSLVVTLVIAAGLTALALWRAYVQKPRKLAAERAALDELRLDISPESSEGSDASLNSPVSAHE